MSKMETISKVSLELPSRIKLERRGARVELSTLDTSHKPTAPPPPTHTHTHHGKGQESLHPPERTSWPRKRCASAHPQQHCHLSRRCTKTRGTPKAAVNGHPQHYSQGIWVDEISCIIYRDLQILLSLVNSKNISMIWTCFILSKTL